MILRVVLTVIASIAYAQTAANSTASAAASAATNTAVMIMTTGLPDGVPQVSITQPNGFRSYNSGDQLIIVWNIKSGPTEGNLTFQIQDGNLGQNKVTPIQNGMLGSANVSALTATFVVPNGIPSGPKYTVVATFAVINMFYSPTFPINGGATAPTGSGNAVSATVGISTTTKNNAKQVSFGVFGILASLLLSMIF